DDGDGALGAVDTQQLTGGDAGGGGTGPGDRGQAVLAADDGRVAHHAADIGDGGLDLAEDRTPRRCGDRCNQDLALLDLGEVIGLHDHACTSLDQARGG